MFVAAFFSERRNDAVHSCTSISISISFLSISISKSVSFPIHIHVHIHIHVRIYKYMCLDIICGYVGRSYPYACPVRCISICIPISISAMALQAAAHSVFTADDPYADNGFLLYGYFFFSAVLAAALDAPKKWSSEAGRRSKPAVVDWV